ncbi:MAG: peptidase M14 [Methyloprofundus sp.]|nr:peptidase M14 [Methyloprofundus sp.]
MQLQQIDSYPEALLSCRATELHALFPQPTLLHLTGKKTQPLFISILLHGNETTGLDAVQQLLKKYTQLALPRSLSIFFGNTLAAEQGLRRLDDQPDYNRIWPGSEISNCAEMHFAHHIVEIMRKKQVFASIDIHNNTGLNPHYSCINKLDNQYLQLANLFGRLIVHFVRPVGVQSSAFAELCPAVTLECGRPGQQHGVDHAFEYIDGCLHLSKLSTHPVHPQDIDLFHTAVRVKIKPEYHFSFSESEADLLFDPQIERLNFTEVKAGTSFGTVRDNTTLPVSVTNEHGEEVSEQYFQIENQQLQLKRKMMPSMLTLDERVIQQDCLCYLMERLQ